jgi:hypothetical protein
VKRREALVALAAGSAASLLPSCGRSAPPDDIDEEQLRVMLRHLAGLDLPRDEVPRVLAALRANRFTGRPDPTTQPQSDFDPEVD